MTKFHGDLRLVAAAYNAGEHMIEVRGLQYANPRRCCLRGKHSRTG
ncbi:MAG: hypothetical protein ACXV8M_00300 [Candidatus Angelobacter sp.]